MPSPIRTFLRSVSKVERWALALFVCAFCISSLVLMRRFYVQNTVLVPKAGGTYIEGSVGELKPLMPWFTIANDVNRDIVSLVFSGLLKYNPDTKAIEPDLADMSISNEGRIYTLKLKPDLYWHDSTKEKPHPVLADDVVFTYQSIQDPAFPNSLLRQNFQGVEVEKLDERSVRFKLDEPYSFFPSNLTLGLLPKRSFEGIPPGKLDQALDFGFAPVGAGPYAFKGLVQTDLSTELTLERFERSIPPDFHLERVVFRVFPDYSTLLSDLRNLGGVRLVPRKKNGDPIVPTRFNAINYTLPQYVALFLNLDRPILSDSKLRLGLQLGTDKQNIIDTLHESKIVDTPLLEIDVSDWRYQFDLDLAQGALFSSNWNLPEKVRLQRLLEQKEANDVGSLKISPVLLLDTGAILTVTGSLVDAPLGSTVNGISVQVHATNTGSWIVALPTSGGTGTLKLGSNIVRLQDPKGRTLDTAYLRREAKAPAYKLASNEQALVDKFLVSRAGEVNEDQVITVADFYLEKGFLRRRLPSDPVDIRINDSGDRLALNVLTSPTPAEYPLIVELIKKQWALLGVHVNITVPDSREEFEKKLLGRDYDVLLFGQSLLDNLDSYPYWHSSGRQTSNGMQHSLSIDAYNLSQYSSLQADTLLELIRRTEDDGERQKALTELREILKADVPAIFLYSPLYTFAYNQDINGVDIKNISLHSDRFLTLNHWYLKQDRQFTAGKGRLSFIPWLFGAQ